MEDMYSEVFTSTLGLIIHINKKLLLDRDNTQELPVMTMLMLTNYYCLLSKLLALLKFTQIIVQVNLLKDERVFIRMKRCCNGTTPAWVQIR